MSKVTELASGTIGAVDAITIELIEPTNQPPIIDWPPNPTVSTPAQFDQVVAAAMRLLSAAVIELAALRVHRRL